MGAVNLTTELWWCSCGRHGHWVDSEGTATAEFCDQPSALRALQSGITVGQIPASEKPGLEALVEDFSIPAETNDWVKSQVNRLNRAVGLDLPVPGQCSCMLEFAAGIEG